MAEPLHIAFVWHMHQPYYRSAVTGAFDMPWARMHALKDYLGMLEMLRPYPDLHQTFNVVPSLVEQLEIYASGEFTDVYWEHTLKPAQDLDPAERTFVVERMCERPDHPRARSHTRYLDLARKREAQASHGWEACARAFSTDELRDLQVWFNLAWFDPHTLESGPLADLVRRGRDFREEDKLEIARAQADILDRTLPAYRDAARRGQVELSTSPYFHPILPLLINSDSARISASDALLPRRRFAHPEDAAEQIRSALVKHESVFGVPARGMWCSEQAVGEDVVSLLIDAGFDWTISDETVLARSLSGTAVPGSRAVDPKSVVLDRLPGPGSLYSPYVLERERGKTTIIFRDHTLSDLIGFSYRAWESRDAAADLLKRLRAIARGQAGVAHTPGVDSGSRVSPRTRPEIPLVTIALDGENAWEYYPRDGKDFLRYLYEGLGADPQFKCVTISEHLRESPPWRTLDWLHTGSWIGGDLRTWSGDDAHNAAWDLLHDARDLASSRRLGSGHTNPAPDIGSSVSAGAENASLITAWSHILVAEGSDWFWWFGDHHHTELDYVWDLSFRLHLQRVYQLLDEPMPKELLLPILEAEKGTVAMLPQGGVDPSIDGFMGAGLDDPALEWAAAGFLIPSLLPAMEPAFMTRIREVRFGWHDDRLCLLVVPEDPPLVPGVQIQLHVGLENGGDDLVIHLDLEDDGRVKASCMEHPQVAEGAQSMWRDVLEASIPLHDWKVGVSGLLQLVLRIGRDGIFEQQFLATGIPSAG